MIPALISVGCVLLTAGFGWAGWTTKQLIGLTASTAAIQAQHVNNGGSTLRDAIDRVDRNLDEHLQQSAADSALLHAHLAHRH